MKLYIIGILIALFNLSCKIQFQPLYIGSIENLKISKINFSGIEGEIAVSMMNPNKFGFIVYPSFFNLSISGIKVGKLEIKNKVPIPAHSEKSISLMITGKFKEIKIEDYMKILSGKFGEIEINGNVIAEKWFYKKRFEISHRQKISLGILPD